MICYYQLRFRTPVISNRFFRVFSRASWSQPWEAELFAIFFTSVICGAFMSSSRNIFRCFFFCPLLCFRDSSNPWAAFHSALGLEGLMGIQHHLCRVHLLSVVCLCLFSFLISVLASLISGNGQLNSETSAAFFFSASNLWQYPQLRPSWVRLGPLLEAWVAMESFGLFVKE